MNLPKLKNKALLSPMAGVTDVAFRALCKKYGAALTYTEFVSSAAIVRGSKATLDIIRTDPSEKPAAVQLFGNSVEEVVAAAKMLEDRFDIIDVNCGCPAWKVIKTGAGSALLNNPENIRKFIGKLVSAINIPVTLKIRAGIDSNSVNALQVAKIAEDSGAAAIGIHGRTQKQGYSGLADWKIIKEVKEKINIPVIGNGDVFSPEDFKEKLEYSNVDYILIARGAIGNPIIFQQINDFMKTGSYKTKSKIEMFFEYLEFAKKYDVNYHYVKNHAIQFTKGLVGGSKVRKELVSKKTVEELESYLRSISSARTS